MLQEFISSSDEPGEEDPLFKCGRLTQEDWCIMEWSEEHQAYCLTAGTNPPIHTPPPLKRSGIDRTPQYLLVHPLSTPPLTFSHSRSDSAIPTVWLLNHYEVDIIDFIIMINSIQQKHSIKKIANKTIVVSHIVPFLAAGIVYFPMRWSLREKWNLPMIGKNASYVIHVLMVTLLSPTGPF